MDLGNCSTCNKKLDAKEGLYGFEGKKYCRPCATALKLSNKVTMIRLPGLLPLGANNPGQKTKNQKATFGRKQAGMRFSPRTFYMIGELAKLKGYSHSRAVSACVSFTYSRVIKGKQRG